jgi:hypothetical protein
MVSIAASSSRDWQFVQSVGGMAIGKPARDGRGNVILPIHCNVSGTRRITTKPNGINSALVCERPSVGVRGSMIFITVRTTVASDQNSDADCPAANLGRLAPGRYSVVYRDPDGGSHPLGLIEVAGE